MCARVYTEERICVFAWSNLIRGQCPVIDIFPYPEKTVNLLPLSLPPSAPLCVCVCVCQSRTCTSTATVEVRVGTLFTVIVVGSVCRLTQTHNTPFSTIFGTTHTQARFGSTSSFTAGQGQTWSPARHAHINVYTCT